MLGQHLRLGEVAQLRLRHIRGVADGKHPLAAHHPQVLVDLQQRKHQLAVRSKRTED